MAYRHGIYGAEEATSLVPMTKTDSGLVVAFGTAPVHIAKEAVPANTPVLCYSYKEAVAAFGYSDDFENYTLCEVMKSHFALFHMAPIVLVNVLDEKNARHTKQKTKEKIKLTARMATLAGPALLSTLKLYKSAEASIPLKEGTDYIAAYNDEDQLLITAMEGGAVTAPDADLYADYTEMNPAGVESKDIVGGMDTDTGKAEGLELIEEVFPRFGLVPGILIAPGWSDVPAVAAVMKTKCTNINGHFRAISIADLPTDTVTTYNKASEWKNQNNYVDTSLAAAWPMVSLGGQKYHLSTQLAGVMNKTDAAHDDIPYYSPSNKNLQADSTVLKDGQEVFLSNAQAAYLNGQGLITALNFIGGWRVWGNRTTAYPANTDVKDTFLPIRRMFNWVLNTLITSFWAKIDDPINRRLIESIMDSANIWLNGLTAKGALLGGRVVFREDENPSTSLMDGKIVFHVYLTPPSPAREIEFIQEYDPAYIATLFG